MRLIRRMSIACAASAPRRTAPAGLSQSGAQYGTLTRLTVEVSYDDGATWHRAALLGRGDHRTALLNQPHNAHYVSLRTTAADTAGNQVTETIIHAYRLH